MAATSIEGREATECQSPPWSTEPGLQLTVWGNQLHAATLMSYFEINRKDCAEVLLPNHWSSCAFGCVLPLGLSRA